MATAAQTAANHVNAQFSTGPRTDAGKQTSARNATKHGFTSKQLVILPGQEEEFALFSEGLHAEFQPQGIYQDLLFRRVLHAAWNLERCRNAEAALYAASPDLETDPILVETNEAKLKLIALYQSRAERSFSQSAKELRRVQTEALYRAEAGITDDLSPLAESKTVDQQIAIDNLRRKQAVLTEIRAFCEEPMPESAPPQPDAPAQTAEAQPQPPDQPHPHPPVDLSDPNRRLRLGFSRSTIFKRNKNKNRNQNQAA